MTLTNRTLAVIADELHAALKRETADILTIGTLLVEAKAQVGHGKWLSWLKQEFSMSERSAQKYMKAAEFAAKNELSADLDLSPSALYLLSEDSHWEDRCDRDDATGAVLKIASEERVDYDRAKEVIDKIHSEVADAEDAKSEVSATSIATEESLGRAKPRGRVQSKDIALINFNTYVLELVQRTARQPVSRFAATEVPPAVLAKLGKFLTDIADLKKSGAKPTAVFVPQGNGTVSADQSAEDRKALNEALGATPARAAA